MRIIENVIKTRKAPIGFAGSDRELELQVGKLKGGEYIGMYQATYYNLADPYIWGECFSTEDEAIADVDKLLDTHIERLHKWKK